MLRHIALFRLKPGTTADQIEAAMVALSTLPEQIDVPRKLRFGSDAGITEGAWDFSVVALLDNADDYLTYRHHPAHVAVLRSHIAPLVSEAARIQFVAGSSIPRADGAAYEVENPGYAGLQPWVRDSLVER